MKLKVIPQPSELKGTYVLVRGSLNVPIENNEPTDIFRLKRLLPTLEYLVNAGAKVILVGHIGRELDDTLLPIHAALNALVPTLWGGPITSAEFKEKRDNLSEGEILLAENLRQDRREVDNDAEFSKLLASFADIYVNDAFDNAHREHASMVGVPTHIPAYPGINFKKEVEELSAVLSPESPSLFLLGGAKFKTKLPLIEKCLSLYDHVFVGGALANDLLKAKGFPVGTSLLSDIALSESLTTHSNILMPIDVTVEGPNGKRVCSPSEVEADESIKDAGPETVKMLQTYITEAHTVLWNGPFGQFEAGYSDITESVAKSIAESDAYSVIGGGDTIASIDKLGINDSFDFLSTGGGAMLTFLEHGTTPAIEYLKQE